jgi:hypothetical protein
VRSVAPPSAVNQVSALIDARLKDADARVGQVATEVRTEEMALLFVATTHNMILASNAATRKLVANASHMVARTTFIRCFDDMTTSHVCLHVSLLISWNTFGLVYLPRPSAVMALLFVATTNSNNSNASPPASVACASVYEYVICKINEKYNCG